MKFRKKPIEVEAIQYTGENKNEIKEFVGDCYMGDWRGDISIHTLEGNMKISIGDFIIKGIRGEVYPCKPDIFKETYDEVDE